MTVDEAYKVLALAMLWDSMKHYKALTIYEEKCKDKIEKIEHSKEAYTKENKEKLDSLKSKLFSAGQRKKQELAFFEGTRNKLYNYLDYEVIIKRYEEIEQEGIEQYRDQKDKIDKVIRLNVEKELDIC